MRFLIPLVMLVAAVAVGQEQPQSETPPPVLKGLSHVYVVVLTTGNEEDEAIKTQVELRCRQAGLSVVRPNEEATPAKSQSRLAILWLEVAVATDKEHGLCSAAMNLSVREKVVPLNAPQTVVRATIWETGLTSLLGAEHRIRPLIRESVDGQLDRFLNEYLAANPKD